MRKSKQAAAPPCTIGSRWPLALGLSLLLTMAAGCLNQPEAAAPAGVKPSPAASVEELPGGSGPNQPAAAVQQAANRYPLTGLVSDKPIHDRPVMVMVENAPQARPQSGLDQADLVYEILAEGEITRFVAVYQAHAPQVIGPVRSIRPYFVELGDMLDALIVHAGWSEDAMNMLADRQLDHFDEVYGDGAYYWRSRDRKAPHNLYTSIENIRQGAANKKFRAEWNHPQASFVFANEKAAPLQGVMANHAIIPYLHGYTVSYEYDAERGGYKRFMDNEPHLDKETGTQLTAVNIIVCESRHRVLDNVGRREVDVRGPGKGYLLQRGQMKEITWQNSDGMIRVYAPESSQEIGLLPGQTWVQLIPEGGGVQVQ